MVSILRRPMSILVVLALLALAIGVKLLIPGTAHAATPKSTVSTDLEVALLRAGLASKAIAAAGVSANSIASVVSAVSDYVSEHPSALSDADDSYATAKVAYDALARKVASGLATENEVTQCASAASTLAAAQASRDAVVTAIFNAGTANLSGGQKQLLTNIRTNASWSLSPEYLVSNFSQSDFVHLRDALAAKKIATKHGQAPDEATTTALATFEQDTAVAAAKTSVGTNAAACAEAWSQAVEN